MDQLKRLRMEKGLSQVKLAARADIDPSTVNQIERGVREPSPATLRKLAEALDVSIAELLEDTSPKADRRSSLEPPLNGFLEEERRNASNVALEAARRQAEQDRQAINRTLASGRPQRYFKNHENEAIVRLLQHPPDELAGALIEMAHRVVQLEQQLRQATESPAEQTAEKSRSTST
jgi:transcriptional regulator with XRE-family HTH domain